eukprot:COSAG01_NODE_620_length_14784_cov_49.916718_2_plen_248_part_00
MQQPGGAGLGCQRRGKGAARHSPARHARTNPPPPRPAPPMMVLLPPLLLAALVDGAAASNGAGASTSAAAAPAPLPAGWADSIGRGAMLARHRLPRGGIGPSVSPPLDVRLRPSIGNGRLATLASSPNVYLAGVYNLVGTVEPFRARLPGLAAMYPLLLPAAGRPTRTTCAAPTPAQRVRCGTPPYTPSRGCTPAQGCCYAPFSPDPKSLPWCYAVPNGSACPSRCHAEVAAPPLPPATSWADDEGA